METFDVVVIGSGYGGSIPAARLAAAGMRTVVLERGPRLGNTEFMQSDDPRYLQTMTDEVVTSSYVLYRTGKLVGGASIPMDGACFRMPARSLEATDSTGRRYWPAAYTPSTLAPYYDRAEAMFQVRQFGWNEIPKAGGLFAKMLDNYGATCERSRLNYSDCLHCGFCAQGCIFDKKFTLLRTYIPLAEGHGAVFRDHAQVSTIEPMGTGWLVHSTRNGVPAEDVWGQRLFVACGGLHTPALLLRSRAHLPNLSSQVGLNFNHNGELQFFGLLPPEFDDLSSYACYKGMDNAGMMTFAFYDSDGFTLHPGGGIEPSVFAASIETADDPEIPQRSWGMQYKRFMESVYPHRVFGFSSLGLADSHGSVTLASDGINPDVVPLADRTSYDAYLDRMIARVTAVATHSGVKVLPAYPRQYAGMTSAHLLASCRMAESAEHGVVDPHCQVWNYPNLYICDASAIPYAMGVNPSLNISAVAEMTADYVIARG